MVGFAQIVEQDSKTVELDRLLVFPEHVRKGIGTIDKNSHACTTYYFSCMQALTPQTGLDVG